VAARHHHAPAAQLLALIKEAQGGKNAKAEAARWHAASASGFDGGPQARAEALKALATFTPDERAAAARLIEPQAKGAVSPDRLVAMAGK